MNKDTKAWLWIEGTPSCLTTDGTSMFEAVHVIEGSRKSGYWSQIRTDFTTLQLSNYESKSNPKDYKYKQAEYFTCLDNL